MQVQKEKESDKALIKQSKNRKLCSEGSALRKQAQKIEKKYKRRIKFWDWQILKRQKVNDLKFI